MSNQHIADKGIYPRLVSNSITYFIGKLAPGFSMLLIIPIITRYYGVDVYGKYSLILSFILLLNAGISGWINQTFMRYYSQRGEEERSQYKIFSIRVLFYFSIFVSLLFLPVVRLLDIEWNIYLFSSILLILVVLYSFGVNYFSTLLYPKRILFVDLIRSVFLITLIGSYGLIRAYEHSMNSKVLYLIGWNIVTYLTAFILFRYLKWKEVRSIFSRFIIERVYLREMLRYGGPLALWFIFSYLLNISDRYVIKYYLSYTEVGTYSAVYDLIYKTINLAFTPFLLALQPILFNLSNSGKKSLTKVLLRRAIVLSVIGFSLIFICISLFRELIVFRFLKLSSDIAIKLIIPTMLGVMMWNIAMLIQKKWELAEKTGILLMAIIIAFVSNLVLNIIFIPKLGLVAASYSTVAGFGIYILLLIMVRWYEN